MFENEVICELVVDVLDCDDVSSSTRFDSIEGWDSVNAMRLFSALEKELGIKVSLKTFLKASKVGDIVDLVNEA
ncbi:MAG: acyl carrier protein [Arenicella sp.]|jgi:acyl carrier protein